MEGKRMFLTRRHPSDDALLLAADDALPRYRQALVSHHLRQCEACRGRLVELDRLCAEAIATCRDLTPAVPASTDAVRARLHTHMTTLSAPWSRSWSVRVRRQMNAMPAVARAGSSLVLVIAIVLGARMMTSQWPMSTSTAFAGVLPIQALTPGAV